VWPSSATLYLIEIKQLQADACITTSTGHFSDKNEIAANAILAGGSSSTEGGRCFWPLASSGAGA
jgi:hypothetical protein